MKFQPGDIVRLKAPPMMVEETTGGGEDVHCVRYEGGQRRQGSYNFASLELVPPDEQVEFVKDGSEPTPDPKFISEEEDKNPPGIETSPITNRVDQLINSRQLAKTAKDTIEAFRNPAA